MVSVFGPAMRLLKGFAERALFCGLLFLMLVEALPVTTAVHRNLDQGIDPFVDATGLWQFPWELFAPEVKKVRVRISAEFTYADGATMTWKSPDWKKRSVANKFRRFREMNFYERLRKSDNAEAWPAYCRFLAQEHGRRDDGSGPVEVELFVHEIFTHPPESRRGEYSLEEATSLHVEDLRDGGAPEPEREVLD